MVTACGAGLEGEDILSLYPCEPLQFLNLGQDPLGPARERDATAGVLRLTLEHFDTVKREVDRGPRQRASLSATKPGVTKERDKAAHRSAAAMKLLYGLIRDDVFALVLAGEQFDFWDSRNHFPICREMQHPAKRAKVMVNRGRGKRARGAFLLTTPLYKFLYNRGIDTVKPTVRERGKFKQGFQMLHVVVLRFLGDSGGKVFQKALFKLSQCWGQAKARNQFVTLPGFGPSGLSFIGLLCAKLMGNALDFDARPPYFSAEIQAHKT
jgi:hypothetical protein